MDGGRRRAGGLCRLRPPRGALEREGAPGGPHAALRRQQARDLVGRARDLEPRGLDRRQGHRRRWMRLQLTAGAVALVLAVPAARAEDRVDASTSWYLERRKG